MESRAESAVIGAFVASAATMPLHWIYDQEKVAQLTGEGTIEFHDPVSCPFYQRPLGSLDCYGAEGRATLSGVVATGGVDDPQALAEHYAKEMEKYEGYKNKGTKAVIEHVAAGKKYPETGKEGDAQANCLVKAAIVSPFLPVDEKFKDRMEKLVKFHQNDDNAVAYGYAAAVIVSRCVKGDSVADALKAALESADVSDAVKTSITDAQAAAKENGKDGLIAYTKDGRLACGLPGSFLVPVYVLTAFDDYTEAIRANIMAGGDQSSRAIFIGACFAAQQGEQGVPDSWVTRATEIDELKSLVEAASALKF